MGTFREEVDKRTRISIDYIIIHEVDNDRFD